MNRDTQPQNKECQGGDCAVLESGSDWFGDLAVSEESEEVSSDLYGDGV
jgi:hypothetical protein